MTSRQFTAVIHQEEDHLWAEVLTLPGCFAAGDDLDELREALEEAITLYLQNDSEGGGTSKPELASSSASSMSVDEMRVSVAC